MTFHGTNARPYWPLSAPAEWRGTLPTAPRVLPVTYGVYAGDIVFRTSPHGVLAQLDNPTVVAFEIDDPRPSPQIRMERSGAGGGRGG